MSTSTSRCSCCNVRRASVAVAAFTLVAAPLFLIFLYMQTLYSTLPKAGTTRAQRAKWNFHSPLFTFVIHTTGLLYGLWAVWSIVLILGAFKRIMYLSYPWLLNAVSALAFGSGAIAILFRKRKTLLLEFTTFDYVTLGCHCAIGFFTMLGSVWVLAFARTPRRSRRKSSNRKKCSAYCKDIDAATEFPQTQKETTPSGQHNTPLPTIATSNNRFQGYGQEAPFVTATGPRDHPPVTATGPRNHPPPDYDSQAGAKTVNVYANHLYQLRVHTVSDDVPQVHSERSVHLPRVQQHHKPPSYTTENLQNMKYCDVMSWASSS